MRDEGSVGTVTVSLRVNGGDVTRTVDARTSLVGFLRETLFLTGTRIGCDTAQCGACTVLVNDRSVKSCNVLVAQVDGASVTTIEGLLDEQGRLHPLQEYFSSHHALQCGYCTAGLIMRSVELLKQSSDTDEQAIREAIAGNICRCTGYHNIVAAIRAAMQARRAEAAARSFERADRVRV